METQNSTRVPEKHKLQLTQPQNTITTNHSQLVVTTCLWLFNQVKPEVEVTENRLTGNQIEERACEQTVLKHI